MSESLGRMLKVAVFLLAFNSCFATTYYVNINNPTPGSGTTWATAFNDLNQALPLCTVFNQVWVAQGVYKPTTTANRTATFKIIGEGSIYGGFNGTETALNQRNITANLTVLSGDIGVIGDASDNSYNVVTFENEFNGLLDGFTVRDGNANAGYPGSTVPQVNNCGGGVLLLSLPGDVTHGTVLNCMLSNNFAVYGGGFCAYGTGTNGQSFYFVGDSRLDNNTAVAGGAGASVALNGDWGYGDFQNTTFTNNACLTAQGSVMASIANAPGADMMTTFFNCVCYNNADPQMYNQQTGGNSYFQVYNTIIWTSGTPYTGPLAIGPNMLLDDCDLDLVTPLSNNLDADPLFVNPAAYDFHVTPCSPVIDAGNFPNGQLNTDLDGNPRTQGAARDMGLYETAKGSPATVPTAVALSPYCQNETATVLTATGTNLLWYTAATGGVGDAAAPTPSTTATGTVSYYVTQTPANSCESGRLEIDVTTKAGAAAPTAVAPSPYCQNATATVLTATGTNLLWYTAATGGVGSAAAPTPSTGSTGTVTYYVSQTPLNSCESARTPVDVLVNANPTADFTWGGKLCAGTAATITATPNAAMIDQYTWDFGGAVSVSGSGAGPYEVVWDGSSSYTVKLTTTRATCHSDVSHFITINPIPTVDIDPVPANLCAGNFFKLQATGATTYQWAPATDLSDPAISDPMVVLQNDVLYSVTGTDGNGCAATAQVALKVGPDCLGYYLPTAFTPNGDGKNDLLRVKTGDTPQYFRMMVFNRFGQRIFESKNPDDGWNGTIGGNPAPTGAYVCVFVATTSAGVTIKRDGTVVLIR